MNNVLGTMSDALKLLQTIGFVDILDILIIAFVVYKGLGLLLRMNTRRVSRGLLILLVILWLSGLLGLNMTNFLLRNVLEIGVIALVILFQPELRRMLEKLGSSKLQNFFGGEFKTLNMENAIIQTVLACADMSGSRTGALIIFERDNQLTEPISTGTLIDAEVTAELLKNIFFVKAPLHDGAVIVKEGRIAAAGCMLPMSNNMNLSKELGMRHRAGIGMSERSDAVVVIVSEETGAISVAVDGMLKRHLSRDTVERLLRKELLPAEETAGTKKSIMERIKVKKNEK